MQSDASEQRRIAAVGVDIARTAAHGSPAVVAAGLGGKRNTALDSRVTTLTLVAVGVVCARWHGTANVFAWRSPGELSQRRDTAIPRRREAGIGETPFVERTVRARDARVAGQAHPDAIDTDALLVGGAVRRRQTEGAALAVQAELGCAGGNPLPDVERGAIVGTLASGRAIADLRCAARTRQDATRSARCADAPLLAVKIASALGIGASPWHALTEK